MTLLPLALLAPAAVALTLIDARPAQAQDAAQDAPVQTAPQTVPDAGMTAADPGPEVRRAAEILNDTVRQMQAGAPPYDRMAPQLAEAVRAQAEAITPMLAQLGDIQDIEYRGLVQGAHRFRVLFAQAPTDWFIVVDDQEIIQGLVFRPGE